MSTPSATQKWFTPAEAASYIGKTPLVLRRYAAAGGIRRWKIGGLQSVRYLRSDLDRAFNIVARRTGGRYPTPARRLSLPEAADHLRVSEITLARYIKELGIPIDPSTDGGSIKTADLDALMKVAARTPSTTSGGKRLNPERRELRRLANESLGGDRISERRAAEVGYEPPSDGFNGETIVW